jgi:hypothetical protein
MAKKKRAKPKFLCTKCNTNLGSAFKANVHFRKNPSHRTEKQQRDYETNRKLAVSGMKNSRRKAKKGSLPTVRRKTATRRTQRFCTNCGTRRLPSHVHCGGCGGKL